MRTPVEETDKLQDPERANRLVGWAFFALAICFTAYLAAAYIYWPNEEPFDFSHDPFPEDPPRPDEPFVWGSLPEAQGSPDETEKEPRLSEASSSVQEASSPSDFPDLDSEDEPYAFFAGPDQRRVEHETVRALESGETQIWEAGDDRGYVLVSTPRNDGDRECRQVSYSLFDGTIQGLSPAVQWCREGSGDWSPT